MLKEVQDHNKPDNQLLSKEVVQEYESALLQIDPVKASDEQPKKELTQQEVITELRKIFEQPLGGQLSPAQEGSVKKSLRGAVNYGKGECKVSGDCTYEADKEIYSFIHPILDTIFLKVPLDHAKEI